MLRSISTVAFAVVTFTLAACGELPDDLLDQVPGAGEEAIPGGEGCDLRSLELQPTAREGAPIVRVTPFDGLPAVWEGASFEGVELAGGEFDDRRIVWYQGQGYIAVWSEDLELWTVDTEGPMLLVVELETGVELVVEIVGITVTSTVVYRVFNPVTGDQITVTSCPVDGITVTSEDGPED